MKTDINITLEELRSHITITEDELQEIRENFQSYEGAIRELLNHVSKYNTLKWELSKISTDIARLNYENYETYMAVHTNSIALSGYRAAIRISGQRLSREVESDLEDLLSKYLMMKF